MSKKTKQRVWHLSYNDDAHHWCEGCGDKPKGIRCYIDEYSDFNPAFWCEHCVKSDEIFDFEVIGWIEDEGDLKKTYYSSINITAQGKPANKGYDNEKNKRVASRSN